MRATLYARPSSSMCVKRAKIKVPPTCCKLGPDDGGFCCKFHASRPRRWLNALLFLFRGSRRARAKQRRRRCASFRPLCIGNNAGVPFPTVRPELVKGRRRRAREGGQTRSVRPPAGFPAETVTADGCVSPRPHASFASFSLKQFL